MAVVYVVITIVMFLIFGPFSKKTEQSPEESVLSISKEERIIGNVGYTEEDKLNLSNDDGFDENETSAVSSDDSSAGSEDTESQAVATETENTEASETEESSGQDSEKADIHYYKFKVINIDSTLRVRDSASFSGKVIARVKNGREGFILEKGEEWSKIVTKEGTYTGYCYNDYLEFTEISKDEFLKDYVDQVK